MKFFKPMLWKIVIVILFIVFILLLLFSPIISVYLPFIPNLPVTQQKYKSIILEKNTAIPAQVLYLYANRDQGKHIAFLLDPLTLSKKEINIDYEPDVKGDNGDTGKYGYRTTRDGKYLLRKANNYLEIASYTKPESFRRIITSQSGEVGIDYQVSQDDSKIAWETYRGDYSGEIYITDVSSGNTKLIKKYWDAEVSMVAFDSINNQIFYYLSYGSMGPYASKIMTLDSNENIISIHDFSYFDFTSAFSPDFTKAYNRAGGDLLEEDLLKGKEKKIIDGSKGVYVSNSGEVSPDARTLLFFDDNNVGNHEPYLINTQNYTIQKISVHESDFDTGDNTYYDWSPDGKYIWLVGYNECPINVNTCTDEVQNSYIYDMDNQTLTLANVAHYLHG